MGVESQYLMGGGHIINGSQSTTCFRLADQYLQAPIAEASAIVEWGLYFQKEGACSLYVITHYTDGLLSRFSFDDALRHE